MLAGLVASVMLHDELDATAKSSGNVIYTWFDVGIECSGRRLILKVVAS